MAKLRVPEADDIFEHFGFKGKPIEYIERQLKIKRTKLRFLLDKMDKINEDVPKQDFYSLKAGYTQTFGYLPVDLSLLEWIEYINTARKILRPK